MASWKPYNNGCINKYRIFLQHVCLSGWSGEDLHKLLCSAFILCSTVPGTLQKFQYELVSARFVIASITIASIGHDKTYTHLGNLG